MPNKQYVKGRRKEYKIVREERESGRIAFRSAGSHSPVDVVSIDTQLMCIKLIQCKPDSMSKKQKEKLEESNYELNGLFDVYFRVE